jgi:general secretion pathway protein E
MNAPESSFTLDPAMLQTARMEFQRSGQDPFTLLESLSGMGGRELLRRLARQFGWPVLETADMLELQTAFDLLPLAKCLSRKTVLLRDGGERMLAAIDNPFDIDLLTWLESHAKEPLQVCLSLSSDIQAYLDKQESSTKAIDAILSQQADLDPEEKQTTLLSFSAINDTASPAVKLVNSTLYDALKAGASDIHFESTASGMATKYRIDGVLNPAATIHGNELAEQAISRIKVLAELDIAERRTPQDGSFRVQASSRDIDLRVSIMPSIHGEDAVIRILDKRAMIEAYGSLTLQALGFDADSLGKLRALAEAAHGMLLVTGPTGSGKTTTLYAAISETNSGRDKIITIEDPVEYQLPGVLQIPVNDKKGLTFARGLRSILRHDPDKIMVGEIRDAETAEIAVQSALTGHLVLTTVHANNVFDVFGRFTHMGIDPYAFVSALNGIWAQRLMRMNCPHCSRPVTPAADEIKSAGVSPDAVADYRFMAGAGCGDCRGSGYKGRKAIAEILVLNDEIRELIIEKAPLRKIKETARNHGTRSMRDTSLALVKRGETTLEEVRRVTLEG